MTPEELEAIPDDKLIDIKDSHGNWLETLTGAEFKSRILVDPLWDEMQKRFNEQINKDLTEWENNFE